MNTVFFDTETTGLKKDKLPDIHPSQPMPIQFGAKLDNSARREMGAVNYLMIPEGWEMGQKAREVTGLNEALATEFGVDFVTGTEFAIDMIRNADMCVAHNAVYDVCVMRRAAYVLSEIVGEPYEDPFEGKEIFCTMLATTPIVKAMPKRNGQWKWPRLEECIKFFFNEELEGAHDALNDVRGCSRVYYELIDIGYFQEGFKFE